MTDASLYRQELLEHYRNPQNFGKLKKATHSAEVVNELCGDEITLQILTDPPTISSFTKEGLRGVKITDARFTGTGCALSVASASFFTEYLKGKHLKKLQSLTSKQAFTQINIPSGPARRKCVLLPYEALKKILTSVSPLQTRGD